MRGAFRYSFSRLLESTADLVPGVLAALPVLLLFWGLAAMTRKTLRIMTRRFVTDETAGSLIRQVGYYSVWTMGLFVAAGALGFEPGNVMTGLGLTSLALGFALKDILSNFVSGILLLILRPFQLGDQIVIGGTEGSVERTELRATQIRTYDGRIVYVPNAEIFTSRVTNHTAAVRSRKHPRSPGPAGSIGAAARLNPAGFQVEMRFWTDSRRSDFAATSAAVRRNAIEALKSAGVSLPDPAARMVRTAHGSGGTEGMDQSDTSERHNGGGFATNGGD